LLWYNDIVVDNPTESGVDDESLACPHCIEPIERFDHFCPHCGKPVTVHATTDPLGQIFSQGHVYRQATSAEPNAITLIGMWLIFSPTVIILVFLTGHAVKDIVAPGHADPYTYTEVGYGGLPPYDNTPVLVKIAGVTIKLIFLILQTAILYLATRNYLRKRNRTPFTPNATDGEM
jgi:hypothetical protein